MARYIHLVEGAATDAWELAVRLTDDGGQARMVRGTKMASRQALFDEVAAALQFPAYFGQNWDAFDECLSSLEDNAPGPWAIVIADAEAVLADAEPRDRQALAECLAAAHNDADLAVYLVTQADTKQVKKSWDPRTFLKE